MPKQSRDEALIRVEETQAALRASIEQVKDLAADAERLLRQDRSNPEEPKPPNPAV